MALALNRAVSPKLLRIIVFDRATIAVTLRRETLTSELLENKGLAEIFRRVDVARSVAQMRNRRIPTSFRSMARV
jgi:hypothetical protein